MRRYFAGLLVVPFVALAACDNHRNNAQADSPSVTNVTGDSDAMGSSNDDTPSSTANAASNTLNDIKTAVTVTPQPQEFVDRAAQSDAFEIAAAKLARTQARSPEVKQFASAMIAAHTKSTATIKAAAAKAGSGLTPHPDLTQDQQGELDDLKKTSGDKFDEDYISGQVSAHRDALALLQRYADSGTEPGLKSAAQQIVPVVQKHLDMARTLQDRLKK